MAKRIDPTPAQRRRILAANAHRCCVCKRRVGLDLHHIDGDHSHTVDRNLAVLCVEDHDRHHRSKGYYAVPNHLELGIAEIRRFKRDWEAFVAEAAKPHPRVFATLTALGNGGVVSAVKLAAQWATGKVAYERTYTVADESLDLITDKLIRDESATFPAPLKVVLSKGIQKMEHCEGCGHGLTRTLNRPHAEMLFDPDWGTLSTASLYTNPRRPSLAIIVGLSHSAQWSASLHLCRGTHLSFCCDEYQYQVKARRGRVRRQVLGMVRRIIRRWRPARVFLGTGDHARPHLTERLELPEVWERLDPTPKRRAP